MKKIRVEDAVGMVIAHDLTKIVAGKFKGPAYKKGDIIKQENIEELKDMGKNHIYVLDLKDNEIHENEAAKRIAKAIDGGGLIYGEPSEGKITFKALHRGIVKINVEAVNEINDIEMVILSTIHNNSFVEEGQKVAGTRIIPLMTEKSKIEKIEEICSNSDKVISINKIHNMKVGIIVTGTEIYEGRVKDRFASVLKEKIKNYGGELIGIEYSPDDQKNVESLLKHFLKKGAEIILTTGGMSVDPDDITPTAIRNVSDEVITYGAPVLPGAMFMLSYAKDTAILGIPACGMYHKTTVFDLIYPRLLAKEKLCRRDITTLGHGGLCLSCETCHYPKCSFGK